MSEQNWKIGDCQNLMKEMEPDSVDLIVTDPPYGYSFMGKDWDRAVPTVNLWKDALRVLKPGAFAFIMSAPRQDVLAHNLVNLSDAGFETGFTSIYWTYASGFPKALNISKKTENKELDGSYGGFQPKPAVEVIMIVMKPLSESTYVDQVMTNQKGITWLDDGRIPFNSDNEPNIRLNAKNHITTKTAGIECFNKIGDDDRSHSTDRNDFLQDLGFHNSKGRFPANLLVSDDVLNDRNITKNSDAIRHNNQDLTSGKGIYNKYNQKDTTGYSDSGSFSRYFDLDAWWNAQIKHLPKNIQKTFPFIITPKASKSEKGGSIHPTIKPVKLFTYLMTIGSRPGNLVLDPFLGSGTTLQAGRLTDRSVIGYELDSQWESGYNSRAMKNIPTLMSFG